MIEAKGILIEYKSQKGSRGYRVRGLNDRVRGSGGKRIEGVETAVLELGVVSLQLRFVA